jgi:hypothetical protein
MNPDYEGLVKELKSRKAIPLVIVYGVENDGGGVDLDYMTTPAYGDADSQLQSDIKDSVDRVVSEL